MAQEAPAPPQTSYQIDRDSAEPAYAQLANIQRVSSDLEISYPPRRNCAAAMGSAQ